MTLSSMKEDSFDVPPNPFIEGKHSSLIDLEIGYHISSRVFPCGLTRQDQVSVIEEKCTCEEGKKDN